MKQHESSVGSNLLSNYGMVIVLLLLCAAISLRTIQTQYPEGISAAKQITEKVTKSGVAKPRVLIVGRDTEADRTLTASLRDGLSQAGVEVVGQALGGPQEARLELERLGATGLPLHFVATNRATSDWAIWNGLGEFPSLGQPKVLTPEGYRWSTFLSRDNLINVANQIVIIAIVAIGMTLVIITAGIDLSSGSLIALSAVSAAWLIKHGFGGTSAGTLGMVFSGLAAILACCGVGALAGGTITAFGIPPFIVTLAIKLVASGLAFMITDGNSISDDIPQGFKTLGVGSSLGLPNAVWLMIALYLLAHVLMEHTALGRHIYAVGGNREAARLSGVPVTRVLIFVYALCGLMAGLGGVIMASQLKSGDPNYGIDYELMAIAAVVVGGTSLAGGEGKIFGTLIGAFIIAVIQNGMNLMGMSSYRQKVILGTVILGAVLLDQLKKSAFVRRRPH